MATLSAAMGRMGSAGRAFVTRMAATSTPTAWAPRTSTVPERAMRPEPHSEKVSFEVEAPQGVPRNGFQF